MDRFMTIRLAVLMLVLATVGLLRAAEDPDWWKAQRGLTARLFHSNQPIAQVVAEVMKLPPSNGQTGLFKVATLIRAGMEDEAISALRELKQVVPDLGGYPVSQIYYSATDQEEAWDVAQAVAEVFAERVTDLSLGNRLLKTWMESGQTAAQIDAWLAARPPGVNSFWVKERLRFAAEQGLGDRLLKELSDGVRREPANSTNALAFLDAVIYARPEGVELSWLSSSVTVDRATMARDLGQRLQHLSEWRGAAVFFERAIQLPVADREVEELGGMRQVAMTADHLRAEFAAGTREALAECLLKLDRAAAAQQRMEEAARIREEHGLGRNAVLSGQVQAASGERTIERQIVDAEVASEKDPQYWRDRALYYRGRGEAAEEEAALKQGWELSEPRLPPERRGKGYADWRSVFLSDYANFLKRHGRSGEAVDLLRREMDSEPASAESVVRAGRLLAFEFQDALDPTDNVLWSWLGKRPVWESVEERLLWRLLENAPEDSRDSLFYRAERLVDGGDASRAFTLGWILNRMGWPSRSIPLLKRAHELGQDTDQEERAAFALLESYLDVGDWRGAEAVFGAASQRLTSMELPEWLGRLAVAAAADGASEDAVRLWRRTANTRLNWIRPLKELAALGERNELIAFYRGLRRELPTSSAPVRALQELGARPRGGEGDQ